MTQLSWTFYRGDLFTALTLVAERSCDRRLLKVVSLWRVLSLYRVGFEAGRIILISITVIFTKSMDCDFGAFWLASVTGNMHRTWGGSCFSIHQCNLSKTFKNVINQRHYLVRLCLRRSDERVIICTCTYNYKKPLYSMPKGQMRAGQRLPEHHNSCSLYSSRLVIDIE